MMTEVKQEPEEELSGGPEKPNTILCPECGHKFSVLKKEK